jgi:hypothetical protein
VYNYYKSNERTSENETGNSQGGPVGTFSFTGQLANQSDMIANMSNVTNRDLYQFYGRNAVYPRFAKITFTKPVNAIEGNLTSEQKTRLKNELSKIGREGTSSLFSRYAVEITDTASDSSLYNVSNASSAGITGQLEIPSNVDPTPDDVYNNSLLNALNRVIQAKGYDFVKSDSTIGNPVVNAVKGFQNGFSFLPQVSQDIVEGSLQNMKNIYMDEIQFLLESSRDVQNTSKRSDPLKIKRSDFDADLPSFKKIPRSNSSSGALKNELIGYIVQKFSFNEDGTVKVYPETVIDSPSNTTFIDPDVAYGARYRYRVLCLYKSDFEAIDYSDGRSQRVIISSLFASNGTDSIIDCIDKVAPPPPVDLKFRYRADESGLAITWNFPVNLQNDIVKFQVLRRSTVSEPFELIKEYSFDSSEVTSFNPESVPDNLIQKSILPVTIHRDTEFTKDSKFIYAIVAIDAHGLSSNYSIQLEASYDRYRNRVNTRLISPSDAPKPYPNIFINNDTFIDAMRMSGYTKLNIYFDPEYGKVTQTNSDGNVVDLEHILFKDNSDNNVYKLMITNTDFQVSRVLDIKINNDYAISPVVNVTTARVFRPL